jgi:ABC-type polysaccharide/polyol phosphate export permease
MAAFGIVFFGFISATITDGCGAFIDAAGMLSQTNLPMFTFVWRVVIRNLINLAHHMVIVIAVVLIFGLWRQIHYAEAVAGFLLLLLNLGWISMIVAIAAARFRDIPQVMTSLMQFATFVTPVFWPAERLTGPKRIVLDLNPFYHLLESVRTPLLGRSVEPRTAILLLVMAALGWLVTFSLFAVTRRRIVHYL